MQRLMRGKLLGSHFFGTQNSRMLQKKNVMHIRWDSTEYTGANLIQILSFESFEYEDAEPTVIQRFFLTHKELNIAEFAKRIGINASLMRNYINGFKKPSPEREALILNTIKSLGEEYIRVA